MIVTEIKRCHDNERGWRMELVSKEPPHVMRTGSLTLMTAEPYVFESADGPGFSVSSASEMSSVFVSGCTNQSDPPRSFTIAGTDVLSEWLVALAALGVVLPTPPADAPPAAPPAQGKRARHNGVASPIKKKKHRSDRAPGAEYHKTFFKQYSHDLGELKKDPGLWREELQLRRDYAGSDLLRKARE